MMDELISLRRAEYDDAQGLAQVHAEAWRQAYLGVLPSLDLERFIANRSKPWWQSKIRQGAEIILFSFDKTPAGYASIGFNRYNQYPFQGEIFELYLKPEYQGIGFGSKLFTKAREALKSKGLYSLIVWALTENKPALHFYLAMGGKIIARDQEYFGKTAVKKIAFGWKY